MVSPVISSCCRTRAYYARSCLRLPLWALRNRLPYYYWCSPGLPFDSCYCRPLAACPERAVTPAAYVEIRALDIERNEIIDERRRGTDPAHTTIVKRLWPFRWAPAGYSAPKENTSTPVAAAVDPSISSATGQYLDVIV